MEAATWCCLHSESFGEAVVQAVNLAGEADTMAAVAGGVAREIVRRETFEDLLALDVD